MKSKLLLGILVASVLAAVVYAALTLIYEKEVQTCTDTDGGFNFTFQGNVTGLKLDNSTYNFQDECKFNGDPSGDNVTVREGVCFVNATKTFVQVWEKDCTDLNMTCQNGRCV